MRPRSVLKDELNIGYREERRIKHSQETDFVHPIQDGRVLTHTRIPAHLQLKGNNISI